MNRNWYAVYTKPQSEMRVVNLLSKKRIESFCPHKRMITGSGSKRKLLYEPLFPSFVFVHISPAQFAEIRKTGEVINFVYWLGSPVVIKTAEIENIASFNGQYYNIEVEKSPVNTAGIVRILNEPGQQPGILDKPYRVTLQLPSLGYTLYAKTDVSPAGVVSFAEKEDGILA